MVNLTARPARKRTAPTSNSPRRDTTNARDRDRGGRFPRSRCRALKPEQSAGEVVVERLTLALAARPLVPLAGHDVAVGTGSWLLVDHRLAGQRRGHPGIVTIDVVVGRHRAVVVHLEGEIGNVDGNMRLELDVIVLAVQRRLDLR